MGKGLYSSERHHKMVINASERTQSKRGSMNGAFLTGSSMGRPTEGKPYPKDRASVTVGRKPRG